MQRLHRGRAGMTLMLIQPLRLGLPGDDVAIVAVLGLDLVGRAETTGATGAGCRQSGMAHLPTAGPVSKPVDFKTAALFGGEVANDAPAAVILHYLVTLTRLLDDIAGAKVEMSRHLCVPPGADRACVSGLS